MANEIKLNDLSEQINLALLEGKFMVLSFSFENRENALNFAQSIGMESDDFEDGSVKVSRMGVNAVELTCDKSANVVLSWQGARPDADTKVDEEDGEDNE